MAKNALLIIDVQYDFLPGGALAVTNGDAVIPVINGISSAFDVVVATQDWHPNGHVSFASKHGKNVGDVIEAGGTEQMVWPEHCVQGTRGAEIHEHIDLRPVKLIVHKGMNPALDSYSAFFENDHATPTGLEYYLRGLQVEDVYVVGLATDYCVFASATDAHNLGFRTTVIEDAARGVGVPDGSIENAIATMKANNITVIAHTALNL